MVKDASPYGQLQKLSVAQALSLTLRKPAQSICHAFIVELKDRWLIIYVLLVCLRAGQPAKGPVHSGAPGVERAPGGRNLGCSTRSTRPQTMAVV